MSVKRTQVSVCERDVPFPLPFRRGEDQGEGLIRQSLVCLNKRRCVRVVGEREFQSTNSISFHAATPLGTIQA